MSKDHRAVTEALVAVTAEISSSKPVEDSAMQAVIQAATAHALLYVGDQLAALVEQQHVQLLITACATSAVTLSDAEYAALQERIRDGLGLTGSKEVP